MGLKLKSVESVAISFIPPTFLTTSDFAGDSLWQPLAKH